VSWRMWGKCNAALPYSDKGARRELCSLPTYEPTQACSSTRLSCVHELLCLPRPQASHALACKIIPEHAKFDLPRLLIHGSCLAIEQTNERHEHVRPCEVTQSAAHMSTSSQYYRNASAHPHYHEFPASSQEHLYALAASSWQQDPNHAPYDGPPSVPFLHYSQGGVGNSDPPPGPTHQTWPTTYVRQESRGWAHPVADPAFASSRTAVSYDTATGGSQPVLQPRPNSEALQQHRHQQTIDATPGLAVNNSQNAYRSIDRDQDLRTPSVSVQRTLCVVR